MTADASAALFEASLWISGAAVVLFLWLMREKPEPGDEAPPGPGASPEAGHTTRRPP